ncbi:type I-U CRISPR-associated helicase/endonuclease Cas3 [Caulobacter sp. S45]|uniref:type I-G CRISPR-associated helicase/endonuclease Cas3g n=1 Tax=Caulobacter sp. S45 TaxID=1641861 RepID=UPI0015766886|nr:type I-U CRISPR-associated helicase/endonuclease Cas3 [Caulobacter sp. S45]
MSLPKLSAGEFGAFFQALWNYPPFPWQTRLAERVAERGWPDLLDLPTGSGKTAALDVAVFALALQADRGQDRQAAMRIAFVVDRRLVVDEAFLRAKRLADALAQAAPGPDATDILQRVALRLQSLAGDGAPPLVAKQMRGGVPREDDWARTPCQPTVLCSTVDQVGSRLLFRGYGVPDSMKPLQAGLLGSDALILLDEAHLSEPFRQTARDIATVPSLRGENDSSPFHVALLTATPGERTPEPFRLSLSVADREHPVLMKRLQAPKLATLVEVKPTDDQRAEALAAQAGAMIKTLRDTGIQNPVVGVVANRIARARAAFDRLRGELGEAAQVLLIIGRARGVDREGLAEKLTPIKTGQEPRPDRPLVIVATQTIEAGVDIDLDGLVTEAASLDALRQRFGRLNRNGRPVKARGVVLWSKEDRNAKKLDPVYGQALGETITALEGLLDGVGEVDFGIEALGTRLAERGLTKEGLAPLLAEKPNAPVLMPAYVDLWTHTSPIPACDPEVALFLHGPNREPASVQLIWRADVDDARAPELMRALLSLAPPRASEAIELPVWAARRWLAGEPQVDLADVDSGAPPPSVADRPKRKAFRWRGLDDERSAWVEADEIAPGDTLVVQASYGGCDRYGWRGAEREPVPVTDVFDAANAPYGGRRYVFRLAPGLIRAAVRATLPAVADGATAEGQTASSKREAERLRDAEVEAKAAPVVAALAQALSDPDQRRGARELVAALKAIIPSELASLRTGLDKLDRAKRDRAKRSRLDPPAFPYDNPDEDDARTGVVLVAPLGLTAAPGEASVEEAASTEDDEAGLFNGRAQSLLDHSQQVESCARGLAERAGLAPELVEDIALAGWLHDAGKADARFQQLLFGGDLLKMHGEGLRAKSERGRSVPGARERANLPPHWRHEALSVRLALKNDRLDAAYDRGLVLWLVGVHHGHGRPFFPHEDRMDRQVRRLASIEGLVAPEIGVGEGPQSLGFVLEGDRFAPTGRDPHDLRGLDWATLFSELKRRYGPWGLARLEAVLRLADHRASEAARDPPEDGP